MGNPKTNDKNSFVLYADYEASFSVLSDEDKGKLIAAIFAYMFFASTFSQKLQVIFP
jgi:hypothetical protein